jgi:hypothetical protein
MKLSFVFIFLLLLPFDGSSLAQKSKTKTPSLNPRQIDFMNRLNEVFNASYRDDIEYFIFQALDGYKISKDEMIKKRADGLRDRTNLPAIIRYYKSKAYYPQITDEKVENFNGVFPSLTKEECRDLLQMSDVQIIALAKKYADYLIHIDTELQKLPKY